MLGRIVTANFPKFSPARTSYASGILPQCVRRRQLQTTAAGDHTQVLDMDKVPVATPQGTIKEGSALKQVRELDTRAEQLYNKHPLSFKNFSLDRMKWRVSANHRGDISPELYYNDASFPTFTHLTPWAVVLKSTVGVRGNLGRQYTGMDRPIDVHEAHQELMIGAGPLIPGGPVNEEFVQYGEWITAIEDKLLDHLVEEVDHYPMLKAEVARLGYSHDGDVRELLSSMMTRSIKYKYGSEATPGEMRLLLRSKLFISPFSNLDWSKRDYACWLDKEVAEKHKLVRLDIHVFDNNGKLFELNERRLDPMDVVAVQAKMNGHLYVGRRGQISIGLMKSLSHIVRLRPGLYSKRTLLRLGYVQSLKELRE